LFFETWKQSLRRGVADDGNHQNRQLNDPCSDGSASHRSRRWIPSSSQCKFQADMIMWDADVFI
jgi:hypothetical protein